MRTQALFEPWDVTRPSWPPRSRLYALEPIGIGTPLVESLSGYIARLADAHAVSVGNLVGRELSARASSALVHPSREQSASDSHGFHARSYVINGMGDVPKQWVQALEAATRRTDLHWLTLLPLEGLFWPHALFRYRRVWCPACFEERRAGDQTVHEPLLWTLKAVTVCPYHRQPLAAACPHCAQPLKPFTVYLRCGYCSKCQKWLGRESPQQDRPTCHGLDGEAAQWYAEQVGALLGAAPRLDPSSLGSTFTANFRACVAITAEGNQSAFAGAAKTHLETVHRLMRPTGLPTLPLLLRISYHLRIPVMTFLQAEPAAAVSQWQEAKGRMQPHRLPSQRSAEKIRAALARAASEQPPPRLSDVARRLNYIKLNRLYQVDARLCRQIASNYQDSIRGPRRKPSDKRFCSLSKMRRRLEAALAQERPPAVCHIAFSLGFVSDLTLRRKFPDLCRAIQEKIDAQKALALANTGRTLKAALREEPPPSLRQLCQRLGCSRPVVLRRHFSTLCNRLLERRRAYRVQQIQKLKKKLHALSLKSPALSLEQACQRVGLSRQRLVTLCPEESAAIVAHYERSRRENAQRRTAELHQQVRRIVKNLHQQGKYPSYKRVKALLGDAGSRDWRKTYATIKAARNELNAASPDGR